MAIKSDRPSPPLSETAASALARRDPQWAADYERLLRNGWDESPLSEKERALILVGIAAAITNLDETSLRSRMNEARSEGASDAEILEVLKMAAVLALHSMSIGATILLEELKTLNRLPESAGVDPSTIPATTKMKAIGQWNTAWDPFATLDPVWTDAVIGSGTGFYTNGVLTPLFVELISIGFDAAITHMYAPGVRRHIRSSLELGATPAQIMAVLKLCVSSGAAALDAGMPLLEALD